MLNVSEATFATTKSLIDATRPSSTPETHRIETARIKSEFLDYIKDEYGYGHSEETATRIAEKAWADGHAYGFGSVEQAAIHWAELAESNFAALREDEPYPPENYIYKIHCRLD